MLHRRQSVKWEVADDLQGNKKRYDSGWYFDDWLTGFYTGHEEPQNDLRMLPMTAILTGLEPCMAKCESRIWRKIKEINRGNWIKG